MNHANAVLICIETEVDFHYARHGKPHSTRDGSSCTEVLNSISDLFTTIHNTDTRLSRHAEATTLPRLQVQDDCLHQLLS